MIKSDTITVFISFFRVVMVKKAAASFTAKDIELIKRMIELSPKERPTFPALAILHRTHVREYWGIDSMR